MELLRTPDERFADLPDFPWEPRYVEVDGLRIAYIDEGPRDAEVVLMMHGEPSWSFLYRKMIPTVLEAGFRAVAPDLPGFGRSDKPSERSDYSYQAYVDWMAGWLRAVDLQRVTLFCQDWGGLIGLRLVPMMPERFSRVCAANTFLPTGGRTPSKAFLSWREFSQTTPVFPVGRIIDGATSTRLSDEVKAAYDAPFLDETFKAGARVFPALVPITPDDPAAEPNKKAWEFWSASNMPFLTLFSDGDPVTAGGDRLFQKLIPGCAGQPHETIEGGGHFLQEDRGEVIAERLVAWMRS